MNMKPFRSALLVIVACAMTLPVWAKKDDGGPRPHAPAGWPVQEERHDEKPAAVMPPAEYVIGAGDVLSISVWKTQELTSQTAVLPDGTISLPLIGTVTAEGLTIGQLREVLKEKLSDYVSEPVVTLMIESIQSQQIYVIGKVQQPGRFLLNARVDVLQALAMAGGPNPYADRDDIRIFRREGGMTVIFTFDYDKVSRGNDLHQNIVLMRGDVIVVP